MRGSERSAIGFVIATGALLFVAVAAPLVYVPKKSVIIGPDHGSVVWLHPGVQWTWVWSLYSADQGRGVDVRTPEGVFPAEFVGDLVVWPVVLCEQMGLLLGAGAVLTWLARRRRRAPIE